MSKQDTHFFNVFSVVLGLLVAFAVLVFALARYVGKSEQGTAVLEEPMLVQAVAGRLASPARVAVAGQDNSALEITPVTNTGGGDAVTVVLENGTQVYDVACKACHDSGLAGAPKAGDAAAWQPRVAKGKPTLYQHAVEGFTGSAGVMPPKGGRTDISDELVHQAVDHMLEML